MKRYLLVVPLLTLVLSSLFGKIRNGYEKELFGYKISLQKLKDILSNNRYLSVSQEQDIKAKIRTLVDYIACHEITNTLLNEFRAIAPDLYNEIDTVKDRSGRVVDVYVKFIPLEEARHETEGIASFQQAANDLHSPDSEYGKRSMSIKVWMRHRALVVLSHEFGHVKYLVPNLKSYAKFYRTRYGRMSDPELGHLPDDPSGKVALRFEKRFRESYARYLKDESNEVVSPLALINPIRKSLSLYPGN